MTWTYGPDDLPEIKHRDAIRNSLPPNAMSPEPTSDAERRDRYAFGDPALRHFVDETEKQQRALRNHEFNTKKEMLDSFQRGHGAPPPAAAPGDHLINPTPNDLSSLDDDDEYEEEGKPFYRVWHEGGDYVGGSKNSYRAEQIMGGHILNHLADEKENYGEECHGCGAMTEPSEHGFSIQSVNDDDNYEGFSPRYSQSTGAISRQSDTIWR